MISRPEAIQGLLDLFEAPRYLEIGVDHGDTFMPLNATRKVAVDPKFNFKFENRSDRERSVEFHEVTSDVYFAERVRNGDVFDVIFLDGLHVAEQTIRDLLNAIMFVDRRGVIIVDDVVPESYHASLASVSELVQVREYLARHDGRLLADQAWMGDVYKVPFFIQTFMQQFSYATIQENHGQTVLWRESRPPQDIKPFSLEGVGRLEFKDFVGQRSMLNVTPFSTILGSIKRSRLSQS